MRVATLTNGSKSVVALEFDGQWYDTGESGPGALMRVLLAGEGSVASYVGLGHVVADNFKPTIPFIPPRNVMCLGKNYLAHAEEFARFNDDVDVVPKAPIVFTKATAALCGPTDDIRVESSLSPELDYETELAVIIGRSGRSIDASLAHEHIAGYSVINDLTARNLQSLHAQWFLGKSLPSASPFGPIIVSPEEIAPRGERLLSTWINGELRQRAPLSEMIVGVEEAIATISKIVPLEVGDVIATGTPSGVAVSFSPPKYLMHGDEIISEIEGIGRLQNRVVIY